MYSLRTLTQIKTLKNRQLAHILSANLLLPLPLGPDKWHSNDIYSIPFKSRLKSKKGHRAINRPNWLNVL